MDRIRIHDLEVFCNHGVYKEETVLGQKFLVDCALYLDTSRAGYSDLLADSVSYGAVCRTIYAEMKAENDRLLERVAWRLARRLLLQYPVFSEVEIEVKKPWAPVMMHLDYASVHIRRGWHKVYLGVGSNMGDRQAFMDLARDRVSLLEDSRNFQAAPVIETAPYGVKDQAPFLNTVFYIETLDAPEKLLGRLQGIEQEAGRTREIHWGPRTLDLDILLYDDLVLSEGDVILPHPDMTNRLFVIEPLCALNPYGIHPLLRERYCDILKRLSAEE